MSVGYYNGVFDRIEEIRIPLSDRCVFFGDGIYDAAIGRNRRIYLKSEHIERFLKNAEKMHIACPYSKDELSALLDETVEKSQEECFFVYFQLTRTSRERRHAYNPNSPSNLLITVTPLAMPNPHRRLKLVTYEDLRYYYCNVKTLNLLPSVLASGYAEARSRDEAIFHRDSIVTECAHSNVSIIKNGVLYTHPTDNMILPGITRASLLEKCREMNIPFSTISFTLDELYSADEVLVTSSTKLCMLAESVDDVEYRSNENSLGILLAGALFADFMRETIEQTGKVL